LQDFIFLPSIFLPASARCFDYGPSLLMSTVGYKLVQLSNGHHAVYSAAYREAMHPGLGPVAEAEALYVRQLKIRERMREGAEPFVVWDVGLGASANAIAALRGTSGYQEQEVDRKIDRRKMEICRTSFSCPPFSCLPLPGVSTTVRPR